MHVEGIHRFVFGVISVRKGDRKNGIVKGLICKGRYFSAVYSNRLLFSVYIGILCYSSIFIRIVKGRRLKREAACGIDPYGQLIFEPCRRKGFSRYPCAGFKCVC